MEEVTEAKFFSVCFNTTPDSSKQDQFSVILQFVDNADKIQEYLIDLVHAKDTTGAGWSCQESYGDNGEIWP